MLLACVGVLLAGLAVMAALPDMPDPAAPMLPILLGSALGGLVYARLPGEMQVHTSGGTGETERIVRSYFVASRYMITAMGNGALCYMPVGSHWRRWGGDSVTVLPCNDFTLTIRGPVLGLARLRRLLEGTRAVSAMPAAMPE